MASIPPEVLGLKARKRIRTVSPHPSGPWAGSLCSWTLPPSRSPCIFSDPKCLSFYCCTQSWGSKICSSLIGPCD